MELWWRRPWTDYALPGGLLLLGLVELSTLDVEGRGYAAAAQVVAAVLLVLRRTHAWWCVPAAGVVSLVPPFFGPAVEDVATPLLVLVVCFYSLARWVPDHGGLGGAAAILMMTLLVYVAVDTRAHDWTDVVFVSSFAVPPYVFGRVARRLADQGELLRRNQELVRREAVRAERDRIARELHDVIAHSVSAMVVQTAAAQDLVRTDPDRAERVLADVAAAGRRALTETGRLLHTVRDDADELGLGPAPGVALLPGLVEESRASGLEVDVVIDELPALAPGLDVSVYRIVQEALTNARKHGREQAKLRLAADARDLTITVTNPVAGTPGGGTGLGLVGIAERVALLGGTWQHGATPEGQFEVHVKLPLTAALDTSPGPGSGGPPSPAAAAKDDTVGPGSATPVATVGAPGAARPEPS